MSNITTIEELKQRIGKFVVLSQISNNFDDCSTCIKLLTKVEDDGWLRHASPETAEKSQFYGLNIWGKYSAKINPFKPFAWDVNKESYSNCYMYARDPTEQEIKAYKQEWRKMFFNHKIKGINEYYFW